MSRAKELENATEKILKLAKASYQRVTNYRCFKCGQVQNSQSKGWPDFFCYDPILIAIECKTGAGRLTPEQIRIRISLENRGIPYLVVRDNVDVLVEFLKVRGII